MRGRRGGAAAGLAVREHSAGRILRRQIVERTVVSEAEQTAAGQFLDDFHAAAAFENRAD